VEELAEVLAVGFGDEEGLPKLNPHWRWEDQEQALLSSCSSLIAIVESDGSRIVEFSHSSVKEFLTSYRLAFPSGDLSCYHIDLEPAHITFAQACMSVLLRSDDRVEEGGIGNISPLAGYAAEHWVVHAQFERVSSLFLRKAMEYLFDPDKPYFAAWVQLYDIDTYPDSKSSSLHLFAVETKFDVTPLYHAALCGFGDLVEHLTLLHPQLVNTRGGYYVTPLVAALAGRHFRTAQFLDRMGADANVSGRDGETPLHSAARYGDLEMVQVLLDYKANVNFPSLDNWTPIHYVSQGSPSAAAPHNIPRLLHDVTRLLLERGADVNARNNGGSTPLHLAADEGTVEVIPLLFEHGANPGMVDNKGRTSLHEAAYNGRAEVVRMLLEQGANASAEDHQGRIPLHEAAHYGSVEVVCVLLEYGANVCAEDYLGRTPLHVAAQQGSIEIVRMLFEHGADVNARSNY
jgi:ankyrin repeat protein